MSRIFFLSHPNDEPSYRGVSIGGTITISWNTKTHKRKFIKREGKYVDKSGKITEDKLFFWGEYEPDSVATVISTTKPIAVHTTLRPVSTLLPMPNNAANTDPYVYGCFRNICCRRGNTKYHPGDILVFGTMNVQKNSIEVDTIIVVKEIAPVSSLLPTDEYFLAAVMPMKEQKKDFVEGVIYSSKSEYFSFVPCLPAGSLTDTNAASAFKKPIIDLSVFGTVVKQSAYGKVCKNVLVKTSTEYRKYWGMITSAVYKCGLELGIYIQPV